MKKDTNSKSQTKNDESDKSIEAAALLSDSEKIAEDQKQSKEHEKKKDSDTTQSIDALRLSEIESTEVVASESDAVDDPDKEIKIIRPAKRYYWWKNRKVLIPFGVILFLIVLLGVPQTRYFALGWAWQKDVKVTVQDNRTGSALKSVTVVIGRESAVTDDSGVAIVKGISLGHHEVVIKKSNYADSVQSVVVDVFTSNEYKATIAATGTVIPLAITDRVSGKAIAEAVVTDKGKAIGKTSATGKIDVVIPVNKKQLTLAITAPEYNVLTTEVTNKTSKLSLTPAGALYFLSKQSGKLDVVKANLDGTERKVIVPGSGSEDDRSTNLIASKDWQYSVLKTKRVSNKSAGLYIISAKDDKYTILDDAGVEFTPIGWSGHYFVYQTFRTNESWRAGSMQLKSYNADTGKTVVLDQSASDPASTQQNYLYEMMRTAHVIDGKLVYTKVWTLNGTPALSVEGKQSSITSVKPDGTDKKTIKSFSVATTSWIYSRQYLPEGIYFEVSSQDATPKDVYSELIGDTYKENVTLPADFNSAIYPDYIVSPNGTASLWSEERDGKQAIFIGDKNAASKQEIAG
ncbi:hypothetical protein HY312_04685 [Candidatus Saccharibacteria bacterium]|nr:hypothetical protein [Candidatus Saccharibacteria bacterium]